MGKENTLSHVDPTWGKFHFLEPRDLGQLYPKPFGFREREGGRSSSSKAGEGFLEEKIHPGK